MKKRLGMITTVILAFGVSMILWGIMLCFVSPQAYVSSLLVLALTFCSVLSVFFFIKAFLLLAKGGKDISRKDRKNLFTFSIIFLLSIFAFLFLMQYAVGFIPLYEERRELVVIKAEEREEESFGQEVTEIPESETKEDIPISVEVPPPIEDIVSVEEKPPFTNIPEHEEIQVFEEIPEETEELPPEIEGETEVLKEELPLQEPTPEPVVRPSSPVLLAPNASLIPSKSDILESEITLIPSSPIFSEPERKLIPSSPVFNEPERALIPSPPVFTEPEREMTGLVVIVPEETDPWADFYLSGDEMEILDGVYWFDLFINGNAMGSITVNVENGEVSLLQVELQDYCSSLITDEAYERIFSEEREWLSASMLSSLGVDAYFDTIAYTVEIIFSPQDMPLQVISISGSNNRSLARPISGATVLEPTKWYIISTYSNNLNISNLEQSNQLDRLRYSLYSSNNFRIKDVYGNFYWSLYASKSAADISWGSIYFYKDFKDEMIRLQWGNVSPDLQGPSGTAVGIRFDKAYQYGNVRRGNGLNKTITLDKDSDVRVYNGENEIFRRNLVRGVYRLEDFTLYTGANHIRIVVSPLDGSEKEEYEVDVNYSSSLLMLGEKYYGAALAFGRKNVTWDSERDDFQLDIWLLNNKKLRYDLRDFSASSYLNIGLTNSLTGYFALSFKTTPNAESSFNPSIRFNSEFTQANALGTAKVNLNLYSQTVNKALTAPSLYLRASEQIHTDWKTLKAMTLTLGYTSPVSWTYDDRHSLYGSASINGTLLNLNYSLSLSGTYVPTYVDLSSWYASASLSFSLGRVGISFFNTFSQRGTGAVQYSAQISASVKIGAFSNSVSVNKDSMSLSSSVSLNNVSLWGRVSTTSITDLSSYSFSGDISHSGKLFNVGGSLSFKGRFENVSASLNASTSTVVAEHGLWSVSSSIPNNFLLIRQKGSIRRNTLAVGEVGYSSQDMPSSPIGDMMYRGLSQSNGTSLSLYSYNEDSLNGAESFDIYLPYSEEKGFVLILEGKETFTLSGRASDDEGNIWANGSSPVYRITVSDSGEYELEETDIYLFTDRRGIFVLSDLGKGLYAFDTKENEEWVLNILEVGEENRYDRVGMVETALSVESNELPYPYKRTRSYSFAGNKTADDFWDSLYGEDMI